MTPYLRWREKNISLYEMVYDKESFQDMKSHIFPQVRKTLATMLGLRQSAVRLRRIGCSTAIYIPLQQWNNRRKDMMSWLYDKRDYSNFLLGQLSVARSR